MVMAARQCKEIITQPPDELQSDIIKFAVVRSMLSNSQEVLVEEKDRRRTAGGPQEDRLQDRHGPRGNRPPETRNSYIYRR
jgi:hypothetical protein